MINKKHIADLGDSLDQLNLMMFCKNSNGQYIYANEVFAAHANVDSPQQIIHKRDSDLEWYKQAGVFLKEDIHVRSGGQMVNYYQIVTKIFESTPILCTKVKLIDTQGICCGVVGTAMRVPANDTSCLEPQNPIIRIESSNMKTQLDEKKLTKGEFKIFKLVILGKTAKEIAKELQYSPRTIEDYIVRIKTKLNCSHKHQLIEYAIKSGIY